MTHGRWVLVTDGPRNRSALAAVRAAAAGGYRPAVMGTGATLASSSRHCCRRVPAPPVEHPDYAAVLREEASDPSYLAVLPSTDAAMLALSAPGAELLDKSTLAARAGDADLPTPPTYNYRSIEALLSAAEELTYPVIVKPALRRYSPYRADRAVDIRTSVEDGPVLVQPFIADGMTAVSGVMYKDRVFASVHQRYLRTWPLDGGVVCAAQSVEGDRGLDERLTELLRGYRGIFQAQFLGPYIIDVHPRVHGSLPLAQAAGVNLVQIYCDLLSGRAPRTEEARPGVLYRWLERDVRSLFALWRAGRIGPGGLLSGLRPRRGVVHSIESLSDPGPMLVKVRRKGG